MALEKILARLRKLIALAKGATEHEAALAAERAAQLMAEHNIAEADLITADEQIVIEDWDVVTHTKRVVWQGQLAIGLADLVGGRHIWEYDNYRRGKHGKFCTLKIIGTPAAIASAKYLWPVFANAVIDLADQAWGRERELRIQKLEDANQRRIAAGKPRWSSAQIEAAIQSTARAFKGAFRTGCAVRLGQRMSDVAKAKRGEGASEHALIILGKVLAKIDARFADAKAVKDRTRPIDARGYVAGVKAAESIPLAASGGQLDVGQLALPEKT